MRRLRSAVRRATCALAADDAGNAVVEFLGVALVLLVPTVYLVLVLGRLQSAAFAVDGAAREAARAFVTTEVARDRAGADGRDLPASGVRAVAATGIALADQGLDPGDAADSLTVTCSAECGAPGSEVTTTVEVVVDLPGVPQWLQSVVPLRVPVSASATAAVDTYTSGG
ncbi:MAG: pilus assembly protein [Cellulomonadaceae bacterium]|nr:pilus assembly protein [Cellulomonadaceae bacterium]